jgi:hypothetical protein
MGVMTDLFGGKTNTKSSSVPYQKTRQYLTGENGAPGIFGESARLYEQGGFTPEMQQAQQQYLQQLQGRQGNLGQVNLPDYNNPAFAGNLDPNVVNSINNPAFGGNAGNGAPPGTQDWLNRAAGDLGKAAYDVAGGAFDTKFNPVANINAENVNLQGARQGQGALDPTKSLSNLLTGNVTNPYLQQQANAMTSNLTRNLNENVMPGIRSEALASGQYGGTRQGLAEGLAASRLNQDLAPALTNMFGGAFENAQQRMYGAASGLNEQAGQNATNNANRQLDTSQFNANLGLQNNQQAMAQNQANLANRMKGLDIAQGGLGLLTGGQTLRSNEQNILGNQQGLRGGEIDIQSGLQGLRSGEQGILGNQQGLQKGLQGLYGGNQQLQLGGQQLQQGQNTLQDQNYAQQMAALGMPQDVNWGNLGNYQNVIYPGAQLGGQQWGSNTAQMGIVPAGLGTVNTIGGLASGFGLLGGQTAPGGFSQASKNFMSGNKPMFSA